MANQESIINALKSVKYPGFSRDVVSFGLVKNVVVDQGTVRVLLELTTGRTDVATQLKQECERVLQALPGVDRAQVEVRLPGATGHPHSGPDPWANQQKVPGVNRVVAIASGKGGVGKSTCAVNLACALRQLGLQIGLMDCDIYGPTIPLMMGIRQRPTLSTNDKMEPPSNYGVRLMSIGFLVDGDAPVIWRGPMIMKTIQQFLMAVEWGELDCLLVDLPPGTGDAQLSLCQAVPLDGGIIVTTPQEASLGVVRKGIAMFEKVQVPILGIVENMSYYTAPGGERVEIFGHGGGRAEAKRQSIEFLGEIPIYTEIRIGGDQGLPVVVSAPQTPPGQAFMNIAATLKTRLSDAV